MKLWLVEQNDNNHQETRRSTVTEVPSRRLPTTTPALRRLEQALENFVQNLEPLEDLLMSFEERLLGFEEALMELEEGALNERPPRHQEAKHQDYQQHPRLLLSPPEVCRELGVDRGLVYRKLSSGEIPSLRLGDAVRVRRADLEDYMRDMKVLKGQRRHLRLVGGEAVGEENSFAET
jgi:excisionase family DNA binding protein